MIDDVKMVRWVFELPFICDRLNKVVDIVDVASAIRTLWDIYESEDADVDDAMGGWLVFKDRAGPRLTAMLLRSRAWMEFFPRPANDFDDTPCEHTLWRRGLVALRVRLTYARDELVDTHFYRYDLG